MIERQCNSLQEVIKCVLHDVLHIYNKCSEMDIISDCMEGNIEEHVRYFLGEGLQEYESVCLFEVSDRYTITVMFISGLANLGRSHKGIYSYGKIRLGIIDTNVGDFLYGHPFDDMSLDEIIEYLRTSEVPRSDKLRYAYHILGEDGSVKYTVYGKDNSCVYTYFKKCGASCVRSSKMGNNKSKYSTTKDGKPYEFIIEREVLKKCAWLSESRGVSAQAEELSLEEEFEQTKLQFPNHVVFKRKGKVYHYDPSNVDEDDIFSQTGLKVYKIGENAALYDPEYFRLNFLGVLNYRGTATEKIPQPINLRIYDWLFYRCECEAINLSDWDFSEVTSMWHTFGVSEMISINLGDADFSKCKNFGACFYDCIGLQELMLGNSRVLADVDVFDMFHHCDTLYEKYGKSEEELTDIFVSGQWDSLRSVKKSNLSKSMEAF